MKKTEREKEEEIAITVIACLHAAPLRGVNQSEQCNSAPEEFHSKVKIGWNLEDKVYHTSREPGKGLYILLSRTQVGPGRAISQEQDEISPNHVQAILSTMSNK